MPMKNLRILRSRFDAWLEENTPAGINWRSERGWAYLGLIAASIFSMFHFGIVYDSWLDTLFTDELRKHVAEHIEYTAFSELIKGNLTGFYILAASMIFLILYHYNYHFQGSKSIYLMRRLPDRWELARRILTLPLLVILASVLTALLLIGFYYLIYLFQTPDIIFDRLNEVQKGV